MSEKSILDVVLCHTAKSGYFTNHGPYAKQFEKTVTKLLCCDCVSVSSVHTSAIMIAVQFPAISWLQINDKRLIGAQDVHNIRTDNISPDHRQAMVQFSCPESDKYNSFLNKLVSQLDIDRSVCVLFDGFSNLSLLRLAINDFKAVIVSHEQGDFVNTFTGATIVSNDLDLLENMRNVRSSYGIHKLQEVPVTSNGRFSEIQAIQGLESLSKL